MLKLLYATIRHRVALYSMVRSNKDMEGWIAAQVLGFRWSRHTHKIASIVNHENSKMNSKPYEAAQEYLLSLRETLIDEVMKVFGASRTSLPGRAVAALVKPAARRLAELAAEFEDRVQAYGLPVASQWILPRFIRSIDVAGQESIPTEGPLLVAANHPGMIDGLIIAAQIPRPDLKIVLADLPFFTSLHVLKERLIYVSRDTYQRLTPVRAAIRHLRSGGAVLLFPGGTIEPDPAVLPGMDRAVERWSNSVNIILRRVPETRVSVGILSGVIAQANLRNPITRLRRSRKDRQRIAEILQAVQHLITPRSIAIIPRLRFHTPISFDDQGERSMDSMPIEAIRKAARILLDPLLNPDRENETSDQVVS